MAGETELTIMGNLTADPELRTLGDGTPVASFTIASTPRMFNRQSNQWEDGQALFMRCSAWRDLANHCASSLSKGVRVIAQGRLRQRSYTANDGSKRMVVEMTVDEIGPSLRYATAQVTRSGQRQGPSGTYGDPQQSVPGGGGSAPSGRALGSDPWSGPDDGFGGDGDEPEF